MNKGIMIIGIVVLILALGGLYVANQQSQQAEQAKMAQEKAAMQKDPSSGIVGSGQDKIMADKSSSRYVEYSKTALDQAANKRRVLYFYASWCPICRPADADLKASSSKIPEDVTVLRVNYNDPETDQEEKDLARKYAVTYQHTFVQIDGQGKEVTTWNGGQTDELLTNLK